MSIHQSLGSCIILTTISGAYHASTRLHIEDKQNKQEPDSVVKNLVKRSEQEQRGKHGEYRSGGRQPMTYGSCGNNEIQCGKPQVEFNQPLYSRMPKIKGGKCTQNGEVPWTVQIQVKENEKYVHRCGGALLSENYVLTACHCFGAVKDKDLLVVLGQDDLNNAADPGEVAFQVDHYWLHEHFQKDGPYSHDLALIRLKRKVDGCGARFTSTVSPICLPDPWTRFADNTTCLVSGWGKTKSHDAIHPECLRAAQLPTMNRRQCTKMYSTSSQNIIDGMICAGKIEGGADACKGDSGGPLVCKAHPNDSFMLAGIVSWGLGCGKAYTPGVFTSVVHYLDWIEEKMDF